MTRSTAAMRSSGQLLRGLAIDVDADLCTPPIRPGPLGRCATSPPGLGPWLSHLALAFVRAHLAVSAVVSDHDARTRQDLLADDDVTIDDATLDRIAEIVQPSADNYDTADIYDAAIPAIAEQRLAAAPDLPSPARPLAGHPERASLRLGTGLQRLGEENTSDVIGRPLLLSSSTNGSRSPRLRAITRRM